MQQLIPHGKAYQHINKYSNWNQGAQKHSDKLHKLTAELQELGLGHLVGNMAEEFQDLTTSVATLVNTLTVNVDQTDNHHQGQERKRLALAKSHACMYAYRGCTMVCPQAYNRKVHQDHCNFRVVDENGQPLPPSKSQKQRQKVRRALEKRAAAAAIDLDRPTSVLGRIENVKNFSRRK